MSSIDKSIVYTSNVQSIHNFTVIKVDDLFKLHRLTQRLEEREKDYRIVDHDNLKLGDIVLAKANSKEYGKLFRAKVTGLHSFVSKATVVHIDTGKLEVVPFSALLQLPEDLTTDVIPSFAIANCKLNCFAPCERSRDVFLAVTTTKKLMLLEKKTHDDGSHEVDLLLFEEDSLEQPVSVTDILV